MVDCECLVAVLACDGQAIPIRELEPENTYGRDIKCFNRLLQEPQHWYRIEGMSLGPDYLGAGARLVSHPSGARKPTVAPVDLQVVHAKRDLANLLAF